MPVARSRLRIIVICMRADKANIYKAVVIVNLCHQTIRVLLDIEHHSVVGNDACVTLFQLHVASKELFTDDFVIPTGQDTADLPPAAVAAAWEVTFRGRVRLLASSEASHVDRQKLGDAGQLSV